MSLYWGKKKRRGCYRYALVQSPASNRSFELNSQRKDGNRGGLKLRYGRRPHIRRFFNIIITYDTPPEKIDRIIEIPAVPKAPDEESTGFVVASVDAASAEMQAGTSSITNTLPSIATMKNYTKEKQKDIRFDVHGKSRLPIAPKFPI